MSVLFAAFHEFLALAEHFGTGPIVLLAVLARLSILHTARGSEPRARFRFSFSLFLLHVLLLVATAVLSVNDASLASTAKVGVGLLGSLAGVTLASVVLFEGIVLRIRPDLPHIVPDVLTTLAAFVGLMRASSQLGTDLSGVIATSAVLTAVIGLSLQDTLGNILGGLALQLDSSVKVGDWVKFGDLAGRVSEIRWRYTAIETRNWETVLVPNSMLTRAQVIVLGRRRGQSVQWRRWVFFNVDFRVSPGDVVEVVQKALRAQPIANVAESPAPNCVAMDLGDSSTRYAVRYWLTDLALDDPTDSLVRNHIFYALKRAGFNLAIPAQAVFVTRDDEARKAYKRATERELRMAALKRIDLFTRLSEEERGELAERLHRAPFAEGETITRQGAAAHHLYMILSGSVSVRVGGLDLNHEVAKLKEGDFFGEMALLTGEPRRASCVALDDVDCYRLDADAFRDLLKRHPELAEHVASVLAQRQTGLMSVKQRVDAEQQDQLRAQHQRDFLARIRTFFELD